MDRNPAPLLQIEVSWDGVIVSVTISGELDITTADNVTSCLLAIGAAHPERIVLDLGGRVIVDVPGARALDEAYHLLQVECPVIIRKPPPAARKIFQMTGLLADWAIPDRTLRSVNFRDRHPIGAVHSSPWRP